MFRTVQQLARALASNDFNLRRTAEEFVRRLEADPVLARNLVDERQEGLPLEFPARTDPLAAPVSPRTGFPLQEPPPAFDARVQARVERTRRQREAAGPVVGVGPDVRPPVTPMAPAPRLTAQPRLFPAPPPSMPRARVRQPGEATPPPRRPRVLGDEMTDARLQENEALHAAAILEAMPEFVIVSIRKAFNEAETSEDLLYALRTYSRFKRAQGVINTAPQGRIGLSGAATETGGGGGTASLGGLGGRIVGEAGMSQGRGAGSNLSSQAAGRTGPDEVYNDILGIDELDELARRTAARLKMENMLPKDMKEYQQEKLLKEIVSEAEVAEAAYRPSDRPTLNRFKVRGGELRSLEDLNRFWSDLIDEANAGRLNKFDVQELRAMAERANTRIVNEILGQRLEPSGVGIAQSIIKGDSVYARQPFEGMLAAISSARTVDEIERIRRLYLRMPRTRSFTPEQIKFFETVAKRQEARLTMSDVELMRMFGYTDWAYATTVTKGPQAGQQRIVRSVPGVEGMNRVIEIPQETPLPIAIRAANRGQAIRDKIFGMMSRRQIDYGRQEAKLIMDNPRFYELRRLTSDAEDRLADIDTQISAIREYGVQNADDEIAKLNARRELIKKELAEYQSEFSRLTSLQVSEAAEEGLRRDNERVREGVMPTEARDKYVAESEEDLLRRVVERRTSKAGREIASRLEMADTQREIEEIQGLVERSMEDNRISEDLGLRILDQLEEHAQRMAGSAIWRGRPRDMDMSTAAPLDPVDPSQYGALGISSRKDIARIGDDAGYETRTADNAGRADVTISVADDFDTGGEFLTKNSSLLAEKEFLTSYAFSPDMDKDVAYIVSRLNEIYKAKGEPLVINGAGNAIDKLGEGVSQVDINNYIGRLFEKIVNHPDRAFEIRGVRTGGQSGADIAWAHASRRLGYPTRIHPAYGKEVFTKSGRKLPESIMVAVGEPYGYKGGRTAFLPVERYRKLMGFGDDPYTFDYQMIRGSFGEGLEPRRMINAEGRPAAPEAPAQDPEIKMTMAMNFNDGQGGRSMRPEFRGKSTMDLIIEGNRTSTTRRTLDQIKTRSGQRLKPGDRFQVTSNDGRKVLVEVTEQPRQIPETGGDAEAWSLAEGWEPSMYDNYRGWWQVRYKFIREL